MTVAHPAPTRTTQSTAPRRVGYGIAAAINLVLLWAANHLLEWGWPPFLTEDFEPVLPIISFSLIVAFVFNVAWLAYDAGWFRAIGNIVQSAISLAVTVRLLQEFPFDFSPYDFDWETVTRTVMVIVCVALGIAILADAIKLLSGKTD